MEPLQSHFHLHVKINLNILISNGQPTTVHFEVLDPRALNIIMVSCALLCWFISSLSERREEGSGGNFTNEPESKLLLNSILTLTLSCFGKFTPRRDLQLSTNPYPVQVIHV